MIHFFSLLNYFKESLHDKKYYFIVGYSFFDPHINNLFFNALSLEQEKFMIIINPSLANDIKEEDFEMNKNLKILKKESKIKVTDYFSNIQKNPIYTEMPDFNITKISSESFEYIKATSEEFLNNITNYLNFIDELRKDKENKTKLF